MKPAAASIELASKNTHDLTRWFTAGLGFYVFAAALLSFIGYVLDVRRLTDWDNDGISIQPNATIVAMAAGAALLLLAFGHGRARTVAALITASIAGATLIEWLSGINLGIDGLLLFDRTWGRRGVLAPGRMGPPGSTAWTLLGIGLLLARKGPKARQAAAYLGLVATGIATLSLIGYLYDVDRLYALPSLTVIALQTSTMVLAVALGLIAALPDRAPMRMLLENSAAGVLVRRSLPFVIGMPIVLGWFSLQGQRAGYSDIAMEVALLVLGLIVLTSIVLVWGASSVAMRERSLVTLNEARVRADMVLGAARDQFVVVDPNWQYTYVNDRVGEVTGIPRAEMLGRSLWELWPAIIGTPLEAAARRVMQSREAETIEYYYAPWDRWFDIRLHPAAEDSLAFFVLEITDRKRAEAALQDADRRKDEFLATLAHELRNPLAPIRAAVDIMERARGDPALEEEARAIIERQTKHMARLVDDLVDISRITRDKLVLKRERTALGAILQQAIETCRPLAESADHDLTLTLPSEPLELDADPVRLVQVFGNLIANACKYTPQGGRIELRAERHGSEVLVAIRDTGLGIPIEMLPKLFELFTQLVPALERSHGGLGIGLALAKRLVEMHGGTISAHSDGLGHGSTFSVRLPLLLAAPVSPTAPPGPARLPTSVRRVLVVDDNDDLATMIAQQLQLLGSETEIAHDGVEAVQKATTYRPDAILLDIGLPAMNGFDVCRIIRKEPWGQGIVIVAMTGWGQEEDRHRSTEAGFNGHLVKPVDPSDLLRALSELSPGAA